MEEPDFEIQKPCTVKPSHSQLIEEIATEMPVNWRSWVKNQQEESDEDNTKKTVRTKIAVRHKKKKREQIDYNINKSDLLE